MSRLTVDDWVDAALEIMTTDGIAGVRIPRLCERLGVTKGSFYWHFKDLDAFLGAIATQWEAGEGRFNANDVKMPDTRAGLEAMVEYFVSHKLTKLERAMRDWARSDPRAKAAIAASDERAFASLVEVFRSMGFGDADADLRAKMLFYAAVGFGDVGQLGRRDDALRQALAMIELLTSA